MVLLNAPDSQLDSSMQPLIQKWSEPEPLSLEILEVLDHCIHGALASGFVVSLLQGLYDSACKNEKTTHEENLKFATWRNTQ